MPTRIALMSAATFGAFALSGCFIAPAVAQGTATKSGGMCDQNTVMVGGSPMSSSKNIVENLSNSDDHTTLVTAIRAAGLVDMFQTNIPLTFFAATNAAFSKLPANKIDMLIKPENAAKLAQILTYSVVAGRLEAADLTDGKKLKTVQGEELTVKCANGKIMIVDANDDAATVTIANVHQSNGVVHVIDNVLMPKAWSQFLPRF